ncbi:SDR family NAD(P)-dependent oxidoreductase [Vibrio breoganii]|uniref:SDR family NAD(P)-dependent oxidoreductase n=1 Tax=Vibrio breoganii TaxID=553239 RepID=UPI000C83CA44|nr:SDR family oxidoreductase [Vibrio breoganii]PMG89927.1 short-chain dehydrogenase [Vibrio breoganii]
MFDLKGKSALVTGATGFLGKEIALSLAEAGAHVYVNSRTLNNCQKLVKEIKTQGGKATVACFDVTKMNEVKKFTEKIELLDILINNSYAGKGGTIEVSNSEDYISSYESSVVASANLFKQLLPSLRNGVKEGGYASVINISSMYGLVSPDKRIYRNELGTNPPFYGACKAALIQWTKYAACEFARENIRVNSISPGPFPSIEAQESEPEMVKQIIQKVPMGRIGQPSELRGPVLFLSSQLSSFVTGTNLSVDGGWTSW